MGTMNDPVKLHGVGITHFRAGRLTEAAQAFAEAYPMAEAAGDRQKAAEILNDLGVAQRELGDWAAAEAALQRAYALFAELGNVKGKAQVLGNLGNVKRPTPINNRPKCLRKSATAIRRCSCGRPSAACA
jgi:Flp pilus assembly protein TadD